MKNIAMFVVIATCLLGCQATPKQEVVVINDKPERVTRNVSLFLDAASRGGAVIRQPSFVHSLCNGNKLCSTEVKQEPSQEPLITPTDIGETMLSMEKDNKKQGFSVYETSRLERYCSHGKNMDEYDWRFIQSIDLTTSTTIIDHCSPTSYSYQQYLSAWSGFCNNKYINTDDKNIIRNSVRPFSVAKNCKRAIG